MSNTILTVNLPHEFEKKLRVNLAEEQFKWLRTSDCIEAYHACATNTVDLVLTDGTLPAITGMDLVKNIREKQGQSELPVILYDEHGTDIETEEDSGSLDTALITKANPDTLAGTIKTTLMQRKSSDPLESNFFKQLDNAMIEATLEIFHTMVMMEIEAGPRRTGTAGEKVADLMGTISLTGLVSGSLTLFMDQEFASMITSQMLGDFTGGQPEIEEVTDAIGEITNMIAGGIKNNLCPKTSVFGISLPTILIGEGTRRICPMSNQCLDQYFKWQDKAFLVEMQVHSLGQSRV